MNKNRVRLTESQLHRVIKESIKRVLNENQFTQVQENHGIISEILKVSGLDDALYRLKHYYEDNRDSIYGKIGMEIYHAVRFRIEEVAKECNYSKSDDEVHAERVKGYDEFLNANPNWKKQFPDGEAMANQPLTISHLRYR